MLMEVALMRMGIKITDEEKSTNMHSAFINEQFI